MSLHPLALECLFSAALEYHASLHARSEVESEEFALYVGLFDDTDVDVVAQRFLKELNHQSRES